jgi:hypothetical protein
MRSRKGPLYVGFETEQQYTGMQQMRPADKSTDGPASVWRATDLLRLPLHRMRIGGPGRSIRLRSLELHPKPAYCQPT